MYLNGFDIVSQSVEVEQIRLKFEEDIGWGESLIIVI